MSVRPSSSADISFQFFKIILGRVERMSCILIFFKDKYIKLHRTNHCRIKEGRSPVLAISLGKHSDMCLIAFQNQDVFQTGVLVGEMDKMI